MTPPDTQDPVSFRQWVEDRQKSAGPRRKGERTRDRIRLAAVELLNEVGYRDMKVSDVCERAGVTTPALYMYFQNKLALTEDVLNEFVRDFMARSVGGGGGSRSAYEAMYDANLRWIASARANAGLMRCMLQLSDEIPEFAEVFGQANHDWYERISQSIFNRYPAAMADEAAVRLATYAFGGMIDEFTRKLFTAHDPRMTALVGAVAPDNEALAGFLTGLWYRGLYGASPPDAAAPDVLPSLSAAAKKAHEAAARRAGRRVAKD